jgi:uncharacterized phage protein gp47/JayE
MGNTPIATIDATGIHKPAFADEIGYFQNGFKAIFGADIVIDNSSQDGQFIGLLGTALDDVNSGIVAAYNSFSPTTALGTGLSSLVKLNGIARAVPSFSNADILVVGVFGTVITNGIVEDANGNQWNLPATVTISILGQITVTAVCQVPGAITAPPNTINRIVTIVPGWQTATNLAAATPGQPVETDGKLRARQAISTELPSNSNIDSVVAAIAALPGVTAVVAYENDQFQPDAASVPGHCIAIVVDGGNDLQIATAIQLEKAPGCGTYGTTAIILNSTAGIPHVYRFFRPAQIVITYNLVVRALNNYTLDVQNRIAQTLSDWTNAIKIGNPLYYRRAYLPAQLYGTLLGFDSFELISLAVARDRTSPTQTDVTFLFNERAICDPSNIQIAVTT